MNGENEIIRRHFVRPHGRDDVKLGIGDDAAVVCVPDGRQLVSAMDTIVSGVHFPADLGAAEIGYRVMAVNLSDFAALGATPSWALLSLSLPTATDDWLESFTVGFFGLAECFDVALIGGDLVKGPLAATVTLLGHVPENSVVTRGGAGPGDDVYVTGSPGAALQSQYRRRPQPRVAEGRALRGIATAMIDVSDGVLTDARHIADASGVQLVLDFAALGNVVSGDVLDAICGGDDYELLFTAPPASRPAVTELAAGWACGAQRIGTVVAGAGVTLPGHDLNGLTGYDHFT